ncbi:MAG: elongation factor P [Caldiserica bacterium]|nr:MAG: elongation factor P [Caldisericota bacterium]
MIDVNNLRPGVTFELDGQVYIVISFLHVKPGKGSAFVRTKIRNIETGTVIEKTFRAGEKVKEAFLEHKDVQYLYNDGSTFYFMDNKTFEQIEIPADFIEEEKYFLKEGMNLSMLFYKGRAIGVELPTYVELEVVETEPGHRGDTAQGGGKPAILETGLKVQVPFFIERGEVVKVDTRTGKYIERVGKKG